MSHSVRRSIIAVIAVGLALGTTVPSALADFDGAPGRVLALDIRDDDSDNSPQRRGQILVDDGDTVTTYTWAPGTTCQNLNDLTTHEEILLSQLVGNKKKLIVPRYKSGLNGARCLVRFWITDKKGLPHIIP